MSIENDINLIILALVVFGGLLGFLFWSIIRDNQITKPWDDEQVEKEAIKELLNQRNN